MEEFPSNSKSKAVAKPTSDQKKIEPVVKSDVVRRKKPLGKRFTEVFIANTPSNVWTAVAWEVLIPAARDMVADAGQEFIQRLIFPDSVGPRRRASRQSSFASNSRVDYRSISGGHPGIRREETRSLSQRSRATHTFDEIILETRLEAEEVIERLFDLLSQYGTASVADLYNLINVTANWTDEKWGWTDLRGAKALKIREGYLLDLPKPEPLN